MTGQEIVKRVPGGLITSPDEYAARIQKWQQEHCHIISPVVSNFSGLPAQHALVVTMATIDANPDHGEVFFNKAFCKPNEVALAKTGLRKIARAAGLNITTERVDPRTVPFYWEFRATAKWTGVDGQENQTTTTQDWDLRDGSMRLRGFTEKQIPEARKHGLRNCETRAINAVIRELGLKQKYQKAELDKPFVVVRVMFQPDMSDPAIRQIAAQAHFQGTQALYPGAPGQTIDVDPLALTEPDPIASDELADLPTAELAGPDPTGPATRDDLIGFVGYHPRREGWFIIRTEAAPLVNLETDSRDVALAAKTALQSKAQVDITSETRGDQTVIVEMRSLEPLKL